MVLETVPMRCLLLTAATVAAAHSLASVHGVQTQLTYDVARNRIDTRSIIFTSPNRIGQPNPINSVSAPRRAYVAPLLYSPIGAGTGWYARPDPSLNAAGHPEHPTGPGPAWQYDDGGVNALPGTGWSYAGSPTLPNLQGSAFTYKLLDGLKRWDGTSFIEPGAEQVQIIASDGTTSFTPTAANSLTTPDGGPPGALTLAAITSRSATNNAHVSLSFRLLGDGTTLVEGDDGIYALKLSIGTSATVGNTGVPVGDSEPFYFLFTKNRSFAEALAVANSLGIPHTLVQGQVPEPAGVAMLTIVALAAARRRRAGSHPVITGGVAR